VSVSQGLKKSTSKRKLLESDKGYALAIFSFLEQICNKICNWAMEVGLLECYNGRALVSTSS
jgi:hypothetical protein